MIARIVYGRETEYFLDGKQVSKEEFDAALPAKPIEAPIGVFGDWAEPVVSETSAVHPTQIQEVQALCAKHGIPTEHDKHGRPVLTSKAHKVAYAKLRGFTVRDHY